jgi:hypothetical protein
MKKLFFLLVMGVLMFSSCGDEEVDTMPPSLQFLDLAPAPSPDMVCGTMEDSVFHLKGGESLELSVRFRDDLALSQYKIDIHNNFDCHGHGGGAAPGVSVPGITNQTEDWTVLEILGLSGVDQNVDKTLAVPENVTTGNYHFQIQVIDESGNDNPNANFYTLKLVNPIDEEAPNLSVTTPAEDFSIAKGATANFIGEVTDNYSLSEGGNGVLYLTYTDLNSGNTFLSNAVFPFDESVEKNYSFDFNFMVPNTLKAGDFIFSVRVHDGVRNVGEPVNFNVAVTD